MTLIRTGLLNAVAVGVRVLSSLALNKILAVYVGPSGYALIGQFQSVVAIVTTFAGGAVNTGVTKGTAEHFDDPQKQHNVWRTAGTISTTGALILGLLVAVGHNFLARQLFGDESLSAVFLWLGVSILPITLNGLLLAILNGKKQFKLFVIINIIGSVVGLILTGVLAAVFGLHGALVALSFNQAIVFVVSAVLCARQPWFKLSMLLGGVDRVAFRDLLKFLAMALTSAMVIPLAQILIRNHLIDQFGYDSAGHWEALNRISGLYLTIVTVPLSVYYLPRLSEIRSNFELRNEIFYGYKIIVPVTILGSVFIFLLRDVITSLLFTPEFYPMRQLFGWQVIGDFMKICGWLLGYVLLARGMAVPFILTELAFSVAWYGLVLICTSKFGEVGAQIGYAVSYVLYFATLSVFIEKKTSPASAHNL